MAVVKSISFDIVVYDALEELEQADRELLIRARAAAANAYAPYSNFQVGAAVLLENGAWVQGSNQENASYPSGLCAERVAIFYAGAHYPGVPIQSIGIAVFSKNYEVNEPAAPCGNCRQAIYEYEHRQKSPIRILMMGNSGKVVQCHAIGDILPLAFNNSYLQ